MKMCKQCGQSKDLEEFYAQKGNSDGRSGKCKECIKKDVRKYRRDHSEKVQAYDRKRGNRQSSEYLPEYRKQNPEKYKAQTAVNNAVRDGRLTKEPCFFCGDKKVHAHHHDYSRPLDVVWLCPSCHKKQHAYEEKIKGCNDLDTKNRGYA